MYQKLSIKTNVTRLGFQSDLSLSTNRRGYACEVQLDDALDLKYTAGKQADEVILHDETIVSGKKFQVSAGIVKPVKYNVQIEVNPELHKYATVTHPRILDPDEELELVFQFHTHKQLDLSKLKYLFKAYLVD